MRLASVGPAGTERPVWIDEAGERVLEVEGGSWREIVAGGGFAERRRIAREAPRNRWRPLGGERLGPPIPDPSKIVAIGLNYRAHAEEQNKKPPEAPLLFAKAPSCLIGAGDPIRIPPQEEKVDAEAELAIVIGTPTKDRSPEAAPEAILGYTILNDVSGRGAQYSDRQWFRGKSYDTFGPCGPWIVPAAEIPDPHDLPLRAFWNDEKMQESSTADLIHGIYDLVAYISRQMTLLPGDLIATGTPSGVGVFRDPQRFLKPGDRVRIEIDRIGTLENPVEAG
ncbi:MAG: 5-carboxymethyl-2-hydroxymuconate isomerase [Candidatus Eisenbacteria bacterium]|nr:5-carboxymethyl-2-hydroxymuconate isomerase [Candidatus Latescibacterota bacterium]MBD3302273.1 5-carboxymethyl-2-hydroxymuconate isomerase [Candidatus Eisenbacteria bacterium]